VQFRIISEYVVAESGKGADALDRRPELAAALAAARAAKSPVIVSKLDRLSRDVAFISGLMHDFEVTDTSHARDLSGRILHQAIGRHRLSDRRGVR
jgi:DNA invertase Pin-like site-specific DNA recombinase